ncbi:hypothetical protein [Frankia sp. AgB32]|uniref:hypothetical protein n=1 Tax=Frankia sp. AgB32 TaxID=631119 RepID=UPI00200E02B0|nr:hypothetical protein [Frankia sp. AgB32]MCK9895327.1 hypothetical protein [Frankia sp. AgB32]
MGATPITAANHEAPEPWEPKDIRLRSMPGTAARYRDNAATLDVDNGIRASDLTSAISLLIPADARLTGVTANKTKATLTFKLYVAAHATQQNDDQGHQETT